MSDLRQQLPVEVLEMIFARLSLRTVFKSVRLVCKRWYSASQLYIVQDVVWNDYRHAKCKYYFPEWKNFDDIVDGIFNVNNNIKLRRTRLVWTSNGDMVTWWQLVVALARLDREYQEYLSHRAEGQDQDEGKGLPSPQRETKNEVVPLTELVLTGDYKFEHRFNLIAPYLQSLTSLQLHIHNTLRINLDLDSILFQTCPALIRLHIRGGARQVRLNSYSLTQRVQESREAYQVQLKLKSLVLHNVNVDQWPLQHYLSLSPHLSELRLRVDIAESLTVADIQGLLNFGSDPTGPTPPQTGAHALSSSSKSRLSSVTDWGFDLRDITPAFKSSLFKVRNL
ncbi:hypothetical protein BGZ82_001031, partial [Podila clonocystis]